MSFLPAVVHTPTEFALTPASVGSSTVAAPKRKISVVNTTRSKQKKSALTNQTKYLISSVLETDEDFIVDERGSFAPKSEPLNVVNVTQDASEKEKIIENSFEIMKQLKEKKLQEIAPLSTLPPQILKNIVRNSENFSVDEVLTHEDRIELAKLAVIYPVMEKTYQQEINPRCLLDKKHRCCVIQDICQDLKEICDKPGGKEKNNLLEEHNLKCTRCFEKQQHSCQVEQYFVEAYEMLGQSDVFHVCDPERCLFRSPSLDPVKHHRLFKKIDWVYFCEQTGTMHVCDRFCNAPKIPDSDRHIIICSISNRSANTNGLVVTVDAPTWRQRSNIGHKDLNDLDNTIGRKKRKLTKQEKDREENDRTYAEVLDACTKPGFAELAENIEFMHQKDGGRKMAGSTSRHALWAYLPTFAIRSKEDAIKYAIIKISILFSRERLLQFDHRPVQFEKDLESKLTDIISSDLNKKQMPNYMQLRQIAESFEKKHPRPPSLKLLADDENKRRWIIEAYAKKCVAMWYVLRTYTDFPQRNSYGFQDFVAAAIKILGIGIEIPQTNSDAAFTLLPKDDFLLLVGNDIHRALPSTKPITKKQMLSKKVESNEIKLNRILLQRAQNCNSASILAVSTQNQSRAAQTQKRFQGIFGRDKLNFPSNPLLRGSPPSLLPDQPKLPIANLGKFKNSLSDDNATYVDPSMRNTTNHNRKNETVIRNKIIESFLSAVQQQKVSPALLGIDVPYDEIPDIVFLEALKPSQLPRNYYAKHTRNGLDNNIKHETSNAKKSLTSVQSNSFTTSSPTTVTSVVSNLTRFPFGSEFPNLNDSDDATLSLPMGSLQDMNTEEEAEEVADFSLENTTFDLE
jgi:hypothetical protein